MQSKMAQKFKHYHRPVHGLVTMDIYRFLWMFGVVHPCAQHSIKKLAAAGQRGAKSQVADLLEARDQIDRMLEMLAEDGNIEAKGVIEAEAEQADKLNQAYSERNRLAVAFTKAALAAGWAAGTAMDNEKPNWDREWCHVVYVSLPCGEQVSWHMSPDEVPLAIDLPNYPFEWNGKFTARDANWPDLINCDEQEAINITKFRAVPDGK